MRLFSSPRWTRCLHVSWMALMASLMLASLPLLAQAQGKERPVEHPTFYRTTQIVGLSIFYREAGPKDAPTLLLLHGFPSSSRMFEALFARLSDRYHLVAPDYPGFGHSDWPDPKTFDYTFDHIASVERKPRLLVVWGEHDPSFDIGEPARYRKDVAGRRGPRPRRRPLRAGHKADEISALVSAFMEAQK